MSGSNWTNGQPADHGEPPRKVVDGAAADGRLVTIRVLHRSSQRHVSVPTDYTFGDLKKLLCWEAGLEPQEHVLLFRGIYKNNDESLSIAGVKNLSKLVLMEDPSSKKRKLEEIRRLELNSRASGAVALVGADVEKLSEKVSGLSDLVHRGKTVEEKEFVLLIELLMQQLLKLDGIEAEGEVKAKRKTEVRKIQSHVATLDALKAMNTSNSLNGGGSTNVSVTTQWETFDSGPEIPPTSAASVAATTSNDWEVFE